jgi:hypothetical protein
MVGVMDRKFTSQIENVHERLAAVTPRSSIDTWKFQLWWARAACAISYFAVKITGKNIFDGFDAGQKSWQLRKAAVKKNVEKSIAVTLATSAMWGFQ